MNWSRYITGWAALEVAGAEPERFLRALAERNIPFWDAAPPADYTVTVRVPSGAVKRARLLAERAGCQVTACRRRGLPALFGRLRRRYALLGLAGAVAAVLFVGSAFVWQIGIEGNQTIPDGIIRQALSQCGVDIGAFWPSFSQDQIRNSVLLRVPGLRWMTVSVRGSHARVVVRESREHLPVTQEKQLVKIVAAKAGLVESVQPLHGTALTEPGSAVLPGEELIGGYTTGRFNVQGPTRAMGTVTARTWYELTAQSPLETRTKVPAGRETVQWALILGKTRINFYKGSSICPAGCDKIIESHTLQSVGVFTLPITLERTVYTAYEIQPAETPGLREQMEELLMQRLLQAVGPDGEVTESQFTASAEDGVMYVTLRAECREQIGTEAPLSEADLAAIQEKIPPKTEE